MPYKSYGGCGPRTPAKLGALTGILPYKSYGGCAPEPLRSTFSTGGAPEPLPCTFYPVPCTLYLRPWRRRSHHSKLQSKVRVRRVQIFSKKCVREICWGICSERGRCAQLTGGCKAVPPVIRATSASNSGCAELSCASRLKSCANNIAFAVTAMASGVVNAVYSMVYAPGTTGVNSA